MHNPDIHTRKEEILSRCNGGLDIILAHFHAKGYTLKPEKGGKEYRSRKWNSEPSRRVHLWRSKTDGRWVYKDYGNDDSGDVFSIQQGGGTGFMQVLEQMEDSLGIYREQTNWQPNQNGEVKKHYDWKEIEDNAGRDEFFGKWGISSETLNRYGVKEISEYNYIGEEKDPFRIRVKEGKQAFIFPSGKNVKVYRPGEKVAKQFSLSYAGNRVFGFEQIPNECKGVIITAGEKDVLAINEMLNPEGYYAICLGSESESIKPELLDKLNQKCDRVFVQYDDDNAGNENSDKAERETGLHALKIPHALRVNDVCDAIEAYETEIVKGIFLDQIAKAPTPETEESEQKEALLKDILSRELDFKNPIEEPAPIISVGNGILSTAGNLTVITGASKVGKSGAIAGMISGTMAVPGRGADTLGFDVVSNIEGKAVIHIDTEQSRYHADRNFRNIIRRAQRQDRPVWYRSFWFTDYGAKQLLEYTKMIVAHCAEVHKGVHMIVIDGIGDYVESVNDDKESNFIVAEFMRIAQEYDCPIITVLHFNPGTEKERGHIGSQLQRKAESIIKIEKDKTTDISTIGYKELRNASRLPELEFRWDDEQNMHVFMGQASKSEQDKRDRERLRKIRDKAFLSSLELSSGELNAALQDSQNIKRRKACDLVRDMKKHSLILLNQNRKFYKSPL